MVAEMQRLENAARMAMGDIHAPEQTAQAPQKLGHAANLWIIAALAMVGIGVFAFAGI
jgi:hypothetical protein